MQQGGGAWGGVGVGAGFKNLASDGLFKYTLITRGGCYFTSIIAVASHLLLKNGSAILRHTGIIFCWFQNMTITFAKYTYLQQVTSLFVGN